VIGDCQKWFLADLSDKKSRNNWSYWSKWSQLRFNQEPKTFWPTRNSNSHFGKCHGRSTKNLIDANKKTISITILRRKKAINWMLNAAISDGCQRLAPQMSVTYYRRWRKLQRPGRFWFVCFSYYRHNGKIISALCFLSPKKLEITEARWLEWRLCFRSKLFVRGLQGLSLTFVQRLFF